ncbi:MFS transporter [Xenorhabdus sp. XENO-7]|uniref:MFS transporter n=1 Tax=Xenorhabdus aichiensis TaxID=3025874 RepID=A0ABT5M7R3_9GAMM|nr:MFS transporter [Xenorhabdus aichiensis]MDC9622301.1 MFS transporter [Xenorhabdus aichiensis]
MSEFSSLIKKLPFSVKALLCCSFLRAVSFFALIPFWPIFLHEGWGLSQDSLGFVLGSTMLIAELISLYGGFLADRYDKLWLIISLDTIVVVLYIILTMVGNLGLIVLLFVLATSASSSIGVAGNALLTDLLESGLRTKVISLRYAIQNIGGALGPALGAWAALGHSRGPLVVAAIAIGLSLLILFMTRRSFNAVDAASSEEKSNLNFAPTIKILIRDRQLMLFLAGGILSMTVYGPLLTYLPQYLSTLEFTASEAYQKVAMAATVNSVVVIALQYYLGGRVTTKHLLAWINVGTIALIIGLLGLASSSLLIVWMIAVTIFTLGEIILLPAEYAAIEQLAPKHLRGSYFGAQNLVYLGLALGPIVCGIVLTYMVPVAMFFFLIGIALISLIFYYLAFRRMNKKQSD